MRRRSRRMHARDLYDIDLYKSLFSGKKQEAK